MAKHRSPAYPVIDLEQAIERAHKLYESDRRAKIPVGIAVEHLGYKQGSGVGLREIAAMRQYGLLNASGRKEDRVVWLSDGALDIVLAPSDDDQKRMDTIRTAALLPTIHAETWEHFGQVIPSDGTLRSFLVREKMFNDTYVQRFMEQFRRTVEFSGLVESDIFDENEINEEQPPTAAPVGHRIVVEDSNMLELPVTLPSLTIAKLSVPKSMTKTDFDCLLSTLKSWQTALVKPDEHNTESEPEE